MTAPNMIRVDCPAGCGDTFDIPLTIVHDKPSDEPDLD